MNIDNLAGMFSQRSGVQQSMGSAIMSAIIGFMAQKMMGQGLGSMLYWFYSDNSEKLRTTKQDWQWHSMPKYI